jgi:Ni/Co efflux regulator RcnB
MKNFWKSTAAIGLVFALSAPLALAQPVQTPHPQANDKIKTHDTGNHDKTVNHDATIQHQTIINQHPVAHPSPWAPNGTGDYLPGHSPGDNRLPIHTQQGLHNEGYPAGGARAWHRGDRYDGPRDVVTNWDAYHLNRPPSGYEYVRNGDQFVLIAVASGVVADVLLNALAH